MASNIAVDNWEWLCRDAPLAPNCFLVDWTWLSVGWQWQSDNQSLPRKYVDTLRAGIGFNVSAYQNDDIKEVNLWLYCERKKVDFPEKTLGITILGGVCTDDAINYLEMNTCLPPLPLSGTNPSLRISHVYNGADYVAGNWYKFKIDTGNWKEHFLSANPSGFIYYLLCSMADDYGYAPGELNDPDGNYFENRVDFAQYEGQQPSQYIPKLEITYSTPAVPRVPVSDNNSPVNPTPTGDEVATSITWGTPRCAFADDGAAGGPGATGFWFMCNGESGANITLQLLTQSGTLLDSVTDSIRTDGNYDWVIPAGTLPNNTEAFVRVYEVNNQIYSSWGRIEKAPSATMALLNIYAVDTVHPQYDFEFSRYAVFKDGLMYVFWKTNLVIGDMDNYSFEIWPAGMSANRLYSATLTVINSGIYQCNPDNYFLAHWRYLIFTPMVTASGFNYYDGLVQNLDADYILKNCGFLEPVIRANAGAVITETHSCYYYVQDAVKDGVAVSLDKSSYDSLDSMTVTVTAGDKSKVPTRLSNVKCTLFNQSGEDCGSALGDISSGTATITLDNVQGQGSMTLRTYFYNETTCPYYQYIVDQPLTMTSGGGDGVGGGAYDDIVKMIQDTLKKAHLNSASGRWLSLIIGMVALFLIFMKSKALRVIMPSLLFCAACVFGWIDIWYIALIALVDGVLIFSRVNKMMHGGGGGSHDDED
jgi:hypothetical protein